MIRNQSTIGNQKSKIPDRLWVIGFAILVLSITTLPYALGYALEGPGWRFSGFVFGVEDGNSYLAKMLGGSAGAWLFYTPYTAAPQGGVLAFLPYLLLGKLAAPPGLHEQLAALFHLFRTGAGFLAILATCDFISFFVKDSRLRWLGLSLAVLGGGLGWVLVLLGKIAWLGSLPLEFYSPEAFGFLGLYGIPHLSLGRAALLWGLLSYLKGVQNIPGTREREVFRTGFKIGAFWLLAALSQPLVAVLFGVLIGLHLAALAVCQVWRRAARLHDVRKWREGFRLALLAGLIPAPFLLYNSLAFSLDPFLKAWTSQNLIPSPHPLHYLLAYGLLLPFAAYGARRLLSDRPWEGLLLAAWVLALPLLVYLPFNLQRRLSEGVWVALVVLAVYGLEGLQARRFAGSSNWSFQTLSTPSSPAPLLPRSPVPLHPLSLLPFLLAFPSTLLLITGGVLAASRPSVPVFRPAGEVAAFQELAERIVPGEIILTSYETGNALPAWAPVRVLIGHGPESAHLSELRPRVAAFYSTAADEERLQLLGEFDVHYIFWGPAERSLGSWDPYQAGYLQPVYADGAYSIFEVLTYPTPDL